MQYTYTLRLTSTDVHRSKTLFRRQILRTAENCSSNTAKALGFIKV